MRSAGAPDIYPNIGKFKIRYALHPHAGGLTSEVWAEGEDFNIPVHASEPLSLSLGGREATRPEEASFISLAPANVALSGMKQSEDGDELIVRLFETEGRSTVATVSMPALGNGAVRRLDLTEHPLAGADEPALRNGQLTVTLKPHEIATVGIRVKQ
jgi:alpha-mannosidase